VITYPVRYGVSGGMSFLVNQNGVVYERNLGKKTTVIAFKMTTIQFLPRAGYSYPFSPTLVHSNLKALLD
jgi:Protein of unknown function (DUF2950)